jgi:hypothetical protein
MTTPSGSVRCSPSSSLLGIFVLLALPGCGTTSFDICAPTAIGTNLRAGAEVSADIRIGRFVDSIDAILTPPDAGDDDGDTLQRGTPVSSDAIDFWISGVDALGNVGPPLDAEHTVDGNVVWLEPNAPLAAGDWVVYGGGLDEVPFARSQAATVEPPVEVGLSLAADDSPHVLTGMVDAGPTDSGWFEYRYRLGNAAWSATIASLWTTLSLRAGPPDGIESCGNVVPAEPGDTLDLEVRQVAADGTAGPWSATARASFP